MAFKPVHDTNNSKATAGEFEPAHKSNEQINDTSLSKGPAVSVQQSLGVQNRGTNNQPNTPIKRNTSEGLT